MILHVIVCNIDNASVVNRVVIDIPQRDRFRHKILIKLVKSNGDFYHIAKGSSADITFYTENQEEFTSISPEISNYYRGYVSYIVGERLLLEPNRFVAHLNLYDEYLSKIVAAEFVINVTKVDGYGDPDYSGADVAVSEGFYKQVVHHIRDTKIHLDEEDRDSVDYLNENKDKIVTTENVVEKVINSEDEEIKNAIDKRIQSVGGISYTDLSEEYSEFIVTSFYSPSQFIEYKILNDNLTYGLYFIGSSDYRSYFNVDSNGYSKEEINIVDSPIYNISRVERFGNDFVSNYSFDRDDGESDSVTLRRSAPGGSNKYTRIIGVNYPVNGYDSANKNYSDQVGYRDITYYYNSAKSKQPSSEQDSFYPEKFIEMLIDHNIHPEDIFSSEEDTLHHSLISGHYKIEYKVSNNQFCYYFEVVNPVSATFSTYSVNSYINNSRYCFTRVYDVIRDNWYEIYRFNNSQDSEINLSFIDLNTGDVLNNGKVDGLSSDLLDVEPFDKDYTYRAVNKEYVDDSLYNRLDVYDYKIPISRTVIVDDEEEVESGYVGWHSNTGNKIAICNLEDESQYPEHIGDDLLKFIRSGDYWNIINKKVPVRLLQVNPDFGGGFYTSSTMRRNFLMYAVDSNDEIELISNISQLNNSINNNDYIFFVYKDNTEDTWYILTSSYNDAPRIITVSVDIGGEFNPVTEDPSIVYTIYSPEDIIRAIVNEAVQSFYGFNLLLISDPSVFDYERKYALVKEVAVKQVQGGGGVLGEGNTATGINSLAIGESTSAAGDILSKKPRNCTS